MRKWVIAHTRLDVAWLMTQGQSQRWWNITRMWYFSRVISLCQHLVSRHSVPQFRSSIHALCPTIARSCIQAVVPLTATTSWPSLEEAIARATPLCRIGPARLHRSKSVLRNVKVPLPQIKVQYFSRDWIQGYWRSFSNLQQILTFPTNFWGIWAKIRGNPMHLHQKQCDKRRLR